MFRHKIILLSIFLTACVSPAYAQPVTKVVNIEDFVFTPTGEAHKTSVAATARMKITQTAIASLPTVTPTPSLTRTLVIPPTPTNTATTSATLTPQATATMTASPSPTPTHTLTPTIALTPYCQEPGGLVIPEQVDSAILGYKVAMRVYLPPCYKDFPERQFPVLYLIHGLNQNERSWNEVGADKTAAVMIAKGQLPPFIIVMPEEKVQQDTSGDFGKVLVNEIVPYTDVHYRTKPNRLYRAIGGLSRGGGWAINIGFQNPDKFGAVGLHSAAIFYGDDSKLVSWIKAVPPGLMPRIYLDIGEEDILLESVKWVHFVFTQQGVRHDYFINKGTHTLSYWRDNLPAYLKWYTTGW
ncbi:MAG: hypothetical protein HY740_01855 [Chloroflexi bacterium]|nr:hypothetical protein [Chloroflexota bacterium]